MNQVFNVVFILAWLINPWLGFVASVPVVSRSKLNDSIASYWIIACLIGFTIILYQLALPIPLDLKNMMDAFETINSHPALRSTWITRDPLSYGSMSVLSWVFPQQPISFYLLHAGLNFGCLWLIFRNLGHDLKDACFRLSFLILLFMMICDFSLTHHYMRQTTAFLMVLLALSLHDFKKYLIFVVAILWHGSAIFSFPAFFLNFKGWTKKSSLVFVGIMVWVYVLGEINVYEFLKVHKPTGYTYHDFTFFDRFFNYFQDPRFGSYFAASKEVGNPEYYIQMVFALFTIGLCLWRKCFQHYFFGLLLTLTTWMTLFHHHVLLFERISYLLSIIVLLNLGILVKEVNFKQKNILPYVVLILCLIKFHFYTWPFTTVHQGISIYLKSPVQLLLSYRDWDINQRP